MIVGAHPIIKELEACEWRAHLVGSRYVGVFDREKSDYDFLVECESGEWYADLKPWLERVGFAVVGTSGYGPDSRLHGSNVWTCKTPGYPNVDVMPVRPEEAAVRLRFFAAMKKVGDSPAGLLAKSLKSGKNWAALWACLHEFETTERCIL